MGGTFGARILYTCTRTRCDLYSDIILFSRTFQTNKIKKYTQHQQQEAQIPVWHNSLRVDNVFDNIDGKDLWPILSFQSKKQKLVKMVFTLIDQELLWEMLFALSCGGCCLYYLLAGFMLGPCLDWQLRSVIRKKYTNPGDDCDDWLTVWCCAFWALWQVPVEFDSTRNFDISPLYTNITCMSNNRQTIMCQSTPLQVTPHRCRDRPRHTMCRRLQSNLCHHHQYFLHRRPPHQYMNRHQHISHRPSCPTTFERR